MKEIVIIGAGAAGLMAGHSAAENGSSVTFIDHNAKPGRKIMITGKGRCNVTNNTDEAGLMRNVVTNNKFLYTAFSRFNSSSTIEFFENIGVPLKTERGGRVFPTSDKSASIVDGLAYANRRAKYIKASAVKVKTENGAFKSVLLDNGEEVEGDALIVATGGKSYPTTGSNGTGYKLLQDIGHTVTPLEGGLVPLEAEEWYAEKMQGLSLKNVTLSLYESGKKKPRYKELGEMLFTHFGISGPLVLTASSYMTRGKSYEITVDLKPALSAEELDRRILRDFGENINRDFKNSLDKLLPQKMVPVIVALSGIKGSTKVNNITKEQRKRLGEVIKNLSFTVAGKRPIEEAIITKGGIKVKEIDPRTMQSKLIKNVYIAGEMIDVDAFTGGYNLQIAFSTGYLAGKTME